MDSESDWSDSFELICVEKVMSSEHHYWGQNPEIRQESDAGRAVCQSQQAINIETIESS